jgi:formylglycine-generating enzyme required for sulfatase activity
MFERPWRIGEGRTWMPLRFTLSVQWPEEHPDLKTASAPENPLLPVPAGAANIGKRSDSNTYGWDNEFGDRHMHVPEFLATKYQVSNAEFLEFVKAGGYRSEAFWTPEGWNWWAVLHAL